MNNSELYLKLYGIQNIYENFDAEKHNVLFACAGVDNTSVINSFIEKVKPKIMIEVGSWLGWSAINSAKKLKQLGLTESVIICVDTWLGDMGAWEGNIGHNYLYSENGYPTVYYKFLSNVITQNVKEYIYPLTFPSNIANLILEKLGIKADLIYIDGSHEALDVYYDCKNYYDLLNPGGYLVGDDWMYEPLRIGISTFIEESTLDESVLSTTQYTWNIKKVG